MGVVVRVITNQQHLTGKLDSPQLRFSVEYGRGSAKYRILEYWVFGKR